MTQWGQEELYLHSNVAGWTFPAYSTVVHKICLYLSQPFSPPDLD